VAEQVADARDPGAREVLHASAPGDRSPVEHRDRADHGVDVAPLRREREDVCSRQRRAPEDQLATDRVDSLDAVDRGRVIRALAGGIDDLRVAV